ncbi:hypothetical protein B0I35DRAFT_360183 [Stachybotrys elegans]|uniref:Uncharacterized protein n=1 Tax=Stachybotrys elegans TaxID=80388 RepID=A0A8K0SIV8_9HYPO|nr:hypothetical protein B0I35DRAFT_360183 [Stachybotrys elegans]
MSTLKVSQSQDGIANIDADPSLWRVLPALSLLIVAQYTASSDMAMRDLAALSEISARPCDSRHLDVSLSDMVGVRALQHALASNHHGVSLSLGLALLSGFLVTLSSLLFTSELVLETRETLLEQSSWFTSSTPFESSDGIERERRHSDRNRLVSLLFMKDVSNLTYPQHTYAELVFPTLDVGWAKGATLQATIPAAKIKPTCVRLPRHLFLMDESLRLSMNHTCANGSAISMTDRTDYTETTAHSYFGAALDLYSECPTKSDVQNPFWRTEIYAWGHIPSSATHRSYVNHLSFWQCNYSWVKVSTEAELIWADNHFLINHTKPPVPVSLDQPWSPQFSVPDFTLNSAFPIPPTEDPLNGTRLSGAFYYMLEPYGQWTVEDFGQVHLEARILEALHRNYALISAQLANTEHRLGIHEASVTNPTHHGKLDPVKATIINSGRHRLVQNETVTYIIVGILSACFAMNATALVSALIRTRFSGRMKWLIDMELQGLAPRGFNSVAMVQALTHYSNFKDYMPEDIHNMSVDELYQHLSHCRFRLGWFGRHWIQDKYFTIGVLGDPDFQFEGGKT